MTQMLALMLNFIAHSVEDKEFASIEEDRRLAIFV